jgi:hypothetical protein
MKGPGGRLRFDLRRVWECPLCHRRDWTGGDSVTRLCNCMAKTEPGRQVWMKLVEVKPAPVVVEHSASPPATTACDAAPADAGAVPSNVAIITPPASGDAQSSQ